MTPVLFIPIGGLGGSQLRATGICWWKKPGLIDAVRAVPGVTVFDNGGWNEFEGKGIWEFLATQPADAAVYIAGHSLGVDTCLHTASALGQRCVGVAIISPVWVDKPRPNCPAVVIKPTSSIFPQANVIGVANTVISNTNHNSVAHDPRVIEIVVASVRGSNQYTPIIVEFEAAP